MCQNLSKVLNLKLLWIILIMKIITLIMTWKSCNIIDWQNMNVTDVCYELPIINGGCHDFCYWILMIMFFRSYNCKYYDSALWIQQRFNFAHRINSWGERNIQMFQLPAIIFSRKLCLFTYLQKNGFGLSDLNTRLKNE